MGGGARKPSDIRLRNFVIPAQLCDPHLHADPGLFCCYSTPHDPESAQGCQLFALKLLKEFHPSNADPDDPQVDLLFDEQGRAQFSFLPFQPSFGRSSLVPCRGLPPEPQRPT